MDYEWRFCNECHQRIFSNEVIGDTIDLLEDELYCIDCADEIKQDNKNKQQRESKLL